jgi:hypothetical protein
MTDTAIQPELEIAAPPTKRAAIESELHNDANRSDREIARVVGCDHKTVAARRREMGIAPPLGNSPPTSPREFRDMLVKGTKEFDAKFQPESAEECVDRMIAEEKISYATAGSGGQGAVRGKDDNAQPSSVADDEGVTMLCPAQWETTIHFNEAGDAVLCQKNWPDDDATIIIRRDNIPDFIDRLTDALGIPSFGRP